MWSVMHGEVSDLPYQDQGFNSGCEIKFLGLFHYVCSTHVYKFCSSLVEMRCSQYEMSHELIL